MTENVNEIRKRCCTGCLSRNNGICKNTGTEKPCAVCGVAVKRKEGSDDSC